MRKVYRPRACSQPSLTGTELKYWASYVYEFKQHGGGVRIVVRGIVAVEVMGSVDRHRPHS